MDRVLEWFAARRVLTLLVCWTYFLNVTMWHEEIQETCHALRRALPAGWFDVLVVATCLVGVTPVLLAATRAHRASRVRRLAVVCWWGVIVLMGLCYLALFSAYIEAIHFIQYALLAIPVFALTGRLGATVVLVSLLGALDEWFQFATLFANWRVQYDVNDVVMNSLGALGGVAAIVTFASAERAPAAGHPFGRWAIWRPFAVTALAFVVGGYSLFATGQLALYREQVGPDTLIQLGYRKRPEARWSKRKQGPQNYTLHPGAALAICLALCAGASALDEFVVFPRTLPPRRD